MADKPTACPNCGHQRYTNSPYCPFCGGKSAESTDTGTVWKIIKALLLAIVAIPFAALGGCAACFVTGMGSMGLPGPLSGIAFPLAISVGLAVFVICLVSIFRQVRF